MLSQRYGNLLLLLFWLLHLATLLLVGLHLVLVLVFGSSPAQPSLLCCAWPFTEASDALRGRSACCVLAFCTLASSSVTAHCTANSTSINFRALHTAESYLSRPHVLSCGTLATPPLSS